MKKKKFKNNQKLWWRIKVHVYNEFVVLVKQNCADHPNNPYQTDNKNVWMHYEILYINPSDCEHSKMLCVYSTQDSMVEHPEWI